MNITDSLIQCLDEVAFSTASEEVLHQLKRCLLDYFAVTYAGRRSLNHKTDFIIAREQAGPCSVLGGNSGTDLFSAVFENGIAAHVLELDDGHRIGAPHLEAPIITAMLALAQQEKLTVDAFLRGILVGYEASIRLSAAIQPGHKLKGFHATGTCGTIAIACAYSYALGYQHDQIKSSISAAVSGASGLLQISDEGSQLKPYNVVNAIFGGVTAAYIGSCGFGYPEDAIGGKRGFLKVFADQVKLDLLAGKYDRPAIMQIYVKPYASCRHSHAAIDCVFHILENRDIKADEITDIEVQTYKLAINGHDQVNPETSGAAKMSIPYSVAAAIVLKNCGISAFNEPALSDFRIHSVAEKIRILENERISQAYPQKRGAIVKVSLTDGSVYEYEVEYPLGDPENCISDAVLFEKYDSLMEFAGIQPDAAESFKNSILHIETQFDVLKQLIIETQI